MATHFTEAELHGVPAIEIEVVSEVLNEADYDQQTAFGDLQEGQRVEFDAGLGDRGPRAENVRAA